MIKKVFSTLVLSSVFISSVSADVFVPDKNYNIYTKEKHMYECGMTNENQTTQYCKIAVNTEEFKKRLEILNWYTDFDTLMQEKIINEVVWDEPIDVDFYKELYGNNYKNYLPEENKWLNSANSELFSYTQRYDWWANWFLRVSSNNEDYFRKNVLSNLFSLLNDLESIVVWYNSIDIIRKNLIKEWIVDQNDKLFESVYIWNIDEIERLGKKYFYNSYHEEDIVKYDTIYFPNIRKYLELKKQWTTFFREFDDWDETSYTRQWYTDEEITKAKAWKYENTYDNKTNFEYTVKQEVEKNILEEPIKYINTDNEIGKTKLEEYAEKWGKNIDNDYPAIEKVIVSYFIKYKKKAWVTQAKVDSRVKLLKEKVPVLTESYEKKYNSTSIKSKKDKYKKFVWILLLVEKVLEKNSF